MNKLWIWGIAGAAVVGLVAGLAWHYHSRQGTDAAQGTQGSYEPQRGSVSGTVACLPHKAGYPQTEECTVGLKGDNGKNYLLDFNLLESSTSPQFNPGTRLSANGVITPIERLSTDHWQSYEVAGIFSVTDSLQIETSKQ